MPTDPNQQPPASAFADDVSLGALLPEPVCEALFRAVVEAGSELGELAPELTGCRPLAYRYSLPPGLVGAYVPVIGRTTGFHVGVLADVCSCDLLTSALHRAREPREPGVRAALSELTYQLGLRVVRRVDPALQLTLGPSLFVDGMARRGPNARLRAVDVAFGSLHATLVLVSLEALRASDWPGRDKTPSKQ